VFRVRTVVPRYGRWFHCVGQEENSSMCGIRKKAVGTVLISWDPKRLLGLCLSCGERREDECVINRTVLAFDSSSRFRTRGARGAERTRDEVCVLAGVSARWWLVGRFGSGPSSKFINSIYI
jgi:hypothetical protein